MRDWTRVTFLTILKLIPKLNLNQTLNRKPSFGEKMKIIRFWINLWTVIGLFSLGEKSFEKKIFIVIYRKVFNSSWRDSIKFELNVPSWIVSVWWKDEDYSILDACHLWSNCDWIIFFGWKIVWKGIQNFSIFSKNRKMYKNLEFLSTKLKVRIDSTRLDWFKPFLISLRDSFHVVFV